jgi:EAL domain-containing protein (putative c-di-GMP-specific phosphodiesterase class I)/FixJ family two-component response regulator
LRGSDGLARLDNVKFGLLWREAGEGELAVRLEALRERLSGAFHLGGDSIMLSVTAGVACYPDHGKEMDALLRNAGMAQHSAHAMGPGAVRLFDDGMASGLERRRWVESALDQALTGRAFRLHYQPKVNLLRQRAVDMEALLRWPQGDGSCVGPAEFIPLLEETGCIVQVGEWVLETAARQVRSWLDAGLPIGRVAVNVSPRQFAQVNLAERFACIAHAAGVPPSKIELEITESCLMRNATRAVETLGALKQRGFFLAMDDFGTGYSSLSYLKRFPLDTLKIDRSFICDVATDPNSAAIVRMIVSLARSRKLRIVAEGVETAEQAALLARIGCDEIQGFFFSRPLDAEACTAWLARGGHCPMPAVDSTRGRTLLLVDDDPAILAALKLLLDDDGYRIFTAENAADGLQQLARNAVDVVISDQRLPSGSGVEFLARVKELYPGTVRMVLSGFADLSSVTDAVNRGAIYKFLTKPWNNSELREIVREAFRQRLVSQDNRHVERREWQRVPGPRGKRDFFGTALQAA